MFTSATFIVEMTGIFGASYLPGLFEPLTQYLRREYRINENNELRAIVTRFHIDNTASLKEDNIKNARAWELIKKADDATVLTQGEWQELIILVSESDGRFLSDVASYREAVDVAFRRGGRLQDYILLYQAPERVRDIARDELSEPKLQFFLRSDLETIRETYRDEYIQQLIRDNPGVYNATPERAYAQQETWLNRVHRLKGLRHLDRKFVVREQYAAQIVDEIVPLLDDFGMDIRRRDSPRDLFLSHAREDKDAFVRPLARALLKHRVSVWYDEFELTVGDSLTQKISEGLSRSRYGVIVLSKSFFKKPWEGWAKSELQGLLARATSGERIILPVWFGVTRNEVVRFSPPLADIVAIDASAISVEAVAAQLANKIRARR